MASTTWLTAGSPLVRAQVPLPPASYVVTRWTIADGLPQTDVRTLALDRDGYLWLGTNVGLTRFDGFRFEDYPRVNGPGAPAPVWSLALDRAGDIWGLWPRLGVGRVRLGGHVEGPEGLALNDFRFLRLAVRNDTAWVTIETGLRRFAGGVWSSLPGLADGRLGQDLSVVADQHGAVWVGGDLGLVRLASDSARAQEIRVAGCNRVFDLAAAPRGGVWIATCRGVEYAGPDGKGSALVIPRPGHLPPQRIATGSDPEVLWIGDAIGVRRFHVTVGPSGRWEVRSRFERGLDLDGSPVVALVDDREGGVWAGTRSAGLFHVRRLVARRLGTADGLPDRGIHHLAPDGHGGLWIGTARGLAHWRDGRIRVHKPPDMGLKDSLIPGLQLDRKHRLWVGQPEVLVVVDSSGQGRRALELPKSAKRWLAPMLEDRRGRVWFGSTIGDVGYFDPDASHAIILPPMLLPSREVWSMAEDAEGGIWIGQDSRVSRFVDTVMVLRLTEEDGVPAGQIRGLMSEPDGSLWIASYGGGLARWRPGQGVRRLPPGPGRFDQLISGIGADPAGRFWLFGDGGLRVFRRSELVAALDAQRPARPAVTLGIDGGVSEGNGGHPNLWMDPKSGWLWLAMVDGLAAVNTAGAPFTWTAPRLRVDDVRIDGVAREPPDTVVVPANAHSLGISFSSPQPGGLRPTDLRYRLVGHDLRWTDAGVARMAHYAALPPGRYTFELMADRPGEDPAEEPERLPVVVEAFWWETLPARLAAVLVGLAGIWGVVLLVTRRLRRRNLVLERTMEEREQARRDAAEAARELAHVSRLATAGELANSLAHELNQPLTAIMGDAQRAQRLAGSKNGQDLDQALKAIVEQTERAAGVIHSLRSFIVKRPTEAEPVGLDVVAQSTIRLLRQELKDRGTSIKLVDELHGGAIVRGHLVPLEQVLVNLILNAADAMHANPAGKRPIVLRISPAPPRAVDLSVTDSGSGIAPENLLRLFEPFYSTKPSGLGLGLSLSRSIVEAHAGRLWAESVPGRGATFHVVLPLGQQ